LFGNLVLSLKATHLIAAGITRRGRHPIPDAESVELSAVNSTLSASERMIIKARRVSLALYPTLLNLSLSAILRNL